jgi:DNA-binding beta-propeller fold protein YncE
MKSRCLLSYIRSGDSNRRPIIAANIDDIAAVATGSQIHLVTSGSPMKILAGGMLTLGMALAWAFVANPYAPEKPSPADIPAVRVVADPYPAFNGIAVDSATGMVVLSDPNRKSLLLYDAARSNPQQVSLPLRQIIGPQTYIGMVAGVVVDSEHREIYAANNDIEDTVVVMSYESSGNARPTRIFSVPHQAWGLALSHSHDQIAVSVEILNALVFYNRTVKGVEAPLRVIRGPQTALADPHGVYWDDAHNEIGVANHGNFRGIFRNIGSGCIPASAPNQETETGRFEPPSITIYAAQAQGDAKPLRVIQGPRTQLDWPMGIAHDPVHNTIVVANNGDNSILIFDRNSSGNTVPVRVIRGKRTGINRPMGVAVNPQDGEIWVSNFGDHSALAFEVTSSGNVAPKRVIRSAPAGTPTPGFGNPMALAYDCKRHQLLVPN